MGIHRLQNTVFHKAIVEEVIELTPVIRRIFLRMPKEFAYDSGQFVIIDFGKLNHPYSTRSYSIADFVSGSLIEICVSLKENGAASPILFKTVKGDVLLVSEPQGRFTLPENTDKNTMGFICTGTGVAPFRAMIKDLLIHRQYPGEVHLFFGCRTRADILYRDEFEALATLFPRFSYTPVLSREKWEGATGYVHEHYEKIFAARPDALIYLCGWTEMLRQTRDRLKTFGYTRSDIRIEFYD